MRSIPGLDVDFLIFLDFFFLFKLILIKAVDLIWFQIEIQFQLSFCLLWLISIKMSIYISLLMLFWNLKKWIMNIQIIYFFFSPKAKVFQHFGVILCHTFFFIFLWFPLFFGHCLLVLLTFALTPCIFVTTWPWWQQSTCGRGSKPRLQLSLQDMLKLCCGFSISNPSLQERECVLF